MRVAQIFQHRLLIIAHAPRKVRIVQPLIPRRFRHVLQHAQLLLHHLLPVPRHLLPLRKHIILDVVSLLGRHSAPVVFLNLLVRPLLRRHPVPLIELLPNLVLLVWRKILKRLAVLQHLVPLLGSQRAHLVDPRPRRSRTHLLFLRRPRSISIGRPIRIIEVVYRGTVRTVILIHRRSVGIARPRSIHRRAISVLILRVRRRCRRLRYMWLRHTRLRWLLRRPVRIRLLLRPSTHGEHGAARHRQHRHSDLESLLHALSSLLPYFFSASLLKTEN